MENKTKVLTGLGMMLPVLSLVPQAVQAQQRPNIVFIFCDDMGYSDLSCYGSPMHNETPNIDNLASQGVRFTDFYSSAPVSTPSRGGLMTGRFHTRLGINHVFMPYSYTGLNPNEVTIPELLKPCGYNTCLYGKWHLGTDFQFLPKRQGFDEFFGTTCSIDNGPFVYIDGDRAQDVPANKDSTTWTYTTKACKYIKAHKGNPFFLYVAYNMPHVPLAASKNFRGKSKNGLYGDVIMELDWSVGEIMKTLKEEGLDDNTIVCFTSDNGPWLHEGPYGGCALPCYSGKGTTWDGGQRVPMIVRWTGHIKPGRVENEMACMLDWFTTFGKMTGAAIPTDRPIDGYDIMPILLGTGHRANHDFAFCESLANSNKLMAYRSGDWKLKLPEKLVKGNYWYPDEAAHDTLLFNIREDIGEKNNVIKQHPEIVKMIVAKIDSIQHTPGFYAKKIFQWEFGTDMLTVGQRRENILNAAKNGIKPKSETGKWQLKNYQLQEEVNKAQVSTY
jgi:arylsulfatase A